jgi:hypothetical protein
MTINPNFIPSYDLGKEVWVIADMLLKVHADFQPMLLWSTVSSVDTNFAAINLMPSLSNKMPWHALYDTPTMLQTSCIVHLQSLQITSHSTATFSGIVVKEVHPQHSSLSSDIQQFLNQTSCRFVSDPKHQHQMLV